MKKALIILLPFIFSFNLDIDPPSKYYYKDDKNVRLSSSNNDTAISIRTEMLDLFNIKTDNKQYLIYYDKKFTLLAVEYDVIKSSKTLTYKLYSRQGQLLISSIQVRNKYVDVYTTYYSSGKIKSRTHYDDRNHSKADTSWYESGIIKTTYLRFEKDNSKHQSFFRNGKIKSETYEGSWQAETSFIIDYDSINGKPSYFLTRDTSIASITDQGEEIVTRYFRKTPIDSAVVKRKK